MNYLPRKPYLIALVATIGLILFYQFGGGVWRPIKARLVGQKTVGMVLSELEPAMNDRIQDLAEITNGEQITLLAFKNEQMLELWKQQGSGWKFVRAYPFTGYSGELGPKLSEGDGQIPEGIYRIESLNPNSSFHLSMKLDYPNSFDRKMAAADGRDRLGYDIFIHGSDASVGCIPIGDQNIEELFYLVAKNGYPNTTVIIAPCDFRTGKTPPEVEGIDWEKDLYAMITETLRLYSIVEVKE